MRGQRWYLRRRRAGISDDAARTSQTTFLDGLLGQAGTLDARMLRRVGLRVEDLPNSEELKQASGVEFKEPIEVAPGSEAPGLWAEALGSLLRVRP